MTTAAVCSIADCDRPFYARGWCTLHYRRWREHGDPNVVLIPQQCRTYVRVPDTERFWAMVDCAGPVPEYRPDLGPCWLWTGSQTRGYGSFVPYGGQAIGAHRWSYQQEHGPLPDELHVDHLCRVPLCVRPAHLEAVTQAENNRRSFAARLNNHCNCGHEFTPENTYWRPDGKGRQCRKCIRLRGLRRRERAYADLTGGRF